MVSRSPIACLQQVARPCAVTAGAGLIGDSTAAALVSNEPKRDRSRSASHVRRRCSRKSPDPSRLDSFLERLQPLSASGSSPRRPDDPREASQEVLLARRSVQHLFKDYRTDGCSGMHVQNRNSMSPGASLKRAPDSASSSGKRHPDTFGGKQLRSRRRGSSADAANPAPQVATPRRSRSPRRALNLRRPSTEKMPDPYRPVQRRSAPTTASSPVQRKLEFDEDPSPMPEDDVKNVRMSDPFVCMPRCAGGLNVPIDIELDEFESAEDFGSRQVRAVQAAALVQAAHAAEVESTQAAHMALLRRVSELERKNDELRLDLDEERKGRDRVREMFHEEIHKNVRLQRSCDKLDTRIAYLNRIVSTAPLSSKTKVERGI